MLKTKDCIYSKKIVLCRKKP